MLSWVSGILLGATAVTALAILFSAKNLRSVLALAGCWAFLVVLVTLGAGVLTGYPRHVTSLTGLAYPFESPQLEVISFQAVPDVAIYIWARNSDRVPLNLALDWDSAMASGLYKAQEETKKNGGKVMLDLDVDRGEGLGQREHNDDPAGQGGGGGGGGGGAGTGASYGTSGGATVFVGQSDFPLKD